MTHDLVIKYCDSIAARLDTLDDSLREYRRLAIKGAVFVALRDPWSRNLAISSAATLGLLDSPIETFSADLQRHIKTWTEVEQYMEERVNLHD